MRINSSSARAGGIAEGTSDCTDEVLDGSMPDTFGGPVDHGGSGRRLPSKRARKESGMGGYAKTAWIPEDRQLHGGLRGFAGADLGRDCECWRAGVPQGTMETLRPGYGPRWESYPRPGDDLDRSFFGQFS